MRMKDFECSTCNNKLEELVDNDTASFVCPDCKGDMHTVFLVAPKLSSVCIPSYPGCKAQRAGYMHTHGNFEATKVQSGYGGSQGPS
jgi:hypothetical protein